MSNMSKKKERKTLIKFSQYLSQQVDRDDPIGDLAKDIRRDEKSILRFFAAPSIPNLSLKRLYTYMQCQFACSEALQALTDAYREWQSLGNTYRATRDDARRAAGWLKLRFLVLQRDGYRCQLCGRDAQDGTKLEVDHKIARARGGTDDLANLWTLCFECNRGKRDRPL